MAGNYTGGKKAAQTNKKRYGEEFYRELGKFAAEKYRERMEKGIAKPRGFAVTGLARTAGKKGGLVKKANYRREV